MSPNLEQTLNTLRIVKSRGWWSIPLNKRRISNPANLYKWRSGLERYGANCSSRSYENVGYISIELL
jgi:hypothetical protein